MKFCSKAVEFYSVILFFLFLLAAVSMLDP